MAQPYVGEIRMFAGNFAPAGWMLCAGQSLSIGENEVLFQLIGTTYGGDGQSTFNLPDLQSRVPVHFGTGPDGITYALSEASGAEAVTLSVAQIPNHTHPMMASADPATTLNPQNNVLATTVTATPYYNIDADTALNAQAVTPQGGNQPHENCQPYLVINFIISLFGIFPSQN